MKKNKIFKKCKTNVINMQQTKKSVTARIPIELYDKCNQHYENMTDAVIAGLELLCNQCKTECKTDCNTLVITNNELNTQLEEKTAKVQELQGLNETLRKEIESIKNNESDNKEILQFQIRIQDMQDRLKEKDESQQARIIDLKEQINLLHDQLRIKDEQIKEKDSQIKNLTTITESQVKGYKLIEAPGAKKPWWRFW